MITSSTSVSEETWRGHREFFSENLRVHTVISGRDADAAVLNSNIDAARSLREVVEEIQDGYGRNRRTKEPQKKLRVLRSVLLRGIC